MKKFILPMIPCLLLFFFIQTPASAQLHPEWQVSLKIKIDGYEYDRYFGAQKNATTAFDTGIDTLAPPPGFNPYTVLWIPDFPNTLQADFRHPDSQSTWVIKLYNAGGRPSRFPGI